MNLNVGRDTSETNPFGYQIGVSMKPDKCSLSPMFFYQLSESVRLINTMSIDSDYVINGGVGAEYEFSPETKVTV